MTMLSFRVDDGDAVAADRWARACGVDRSELLRDALHRHVVRLAAEADIASWQRQPLSDGEESLASIADWGPAEDWREWTDSKG